MPLGQTLTRLVTDRLSRSKISIIETKPRAIASLIHQPQRPRPSLLIYPRLSQLLFRQIGQQACQLFRISRRRVLHHSRSRYLLPIPLIPQIRQSQWLLRSQRSQHCCQLLDQLLHLHCFQVLSHPCILLLSQLTSPRRAPHRSRHHSLLLTPVSLRSRRPPRCPRRSGSVSKSRPRPKPTSQDSTPSPISMNPSACFSALLWRRRWVSSSPRTM